jgi:iron complex transport system substrate-binding protein
VAAHPTSLTGRVALALVIPLALTTAAGQGQSPRRIVSLVPAVTEMLFAIGAGDEVVGVSSFDEYPPEVRSKPRVGALIDPDLERILSLRPTLAIVYASQADLRQQLRRAGVAEFAYRHAGLRELPGTIRTIGDLVGRPARARELAGSIERDLDAIRRRVAGLPRPDTMLVFSRETGSLRSIYVSGGVGFLNDMLEAAGGRNVFGDVARENLQASLEQILKRAPEVIVEVRVGPASDLDVEQVAREWQGLSVPAVRNRRVHVWRDPSLVVPGPRVVGATELLASLLHPPGPGAGRAHGSGLRAQGSGLRTDSRLATHDRHSTNSTGIFPATSPLFQASSNRRSTACRPLAP